MSAVHRVRAAAFLAVGSASLLSLALACGSSSSDGSGGATTDGKDGSTGTTNGNGTGDGSSGGTGTSASADSSTGTGSGGNDDGGTGSTAPTRGCAAYPKAGFCDDFENETDATFASNWTDIYSNDIQFERPVAIASTTAFSGSHVLHEDAELVADAGTSGPSGQRFSEINRELPTVLASQTLTVGYSYRVVSYQDLDGSYAGGASPDFQIVIGSCLVQIQGSDATHMAANVCGVEGANRGPTVIVPFTVGSWQRVEVHADFVATDAGAGTVSLIIDGTTIVSEPLTGGGSHSLGPVTYSGSMSIGAFAFAEVPSSVIDIDDVVIEQD